MSVSKLNFPSVRPSEKRQSINRGIHFSLSFFNRAGDGECIMDPKQVNVLDLPKRPGFVEAPIEHLARHLPVPTISDIDENELDEMDSTLQVSAVNSTRQKRQAGVVILPEAIVDNEGKTRHVVTMVNIPQSTSTISLTLNETLPPPPHFPN